MQIPETHFVNGHRIQPPFPDGLERALFGLGCFWGAEKTFGSCRGLLHRGRLRRGTSEPDYRQVCSGPPATPRPCWCSTIPSASATSSCCACSGNHTPDAGHAPRQRSSAPNTAR